MYQYDTESASLSNNKDSNSTKTKLISREHFVTKGDTLYSISKKYDVPIEDLKRNNNILENEIAIGQSILILK
jgi:LysM repeat protein